MISRLKHKAKEFIKDNFFRIHAAYVAPSPHSNIQKSAVYLEWIANSLVVIVNEFVESESLSDSRLVNRLNGIFKTKRFGLLVNRLVVEYFLSLFNKLYEISNVPVKDHQYVSLEDNPINRFGVKKYREQFSLSSDDIHWLAPLSPWRHLVSIGILGSYIFYHSIKSGMKISFKKKKYKVLREALWGLEGCGYFFRDDFLIDGKLIQKEDILFFGRSIMMSDPHGRMKAYYDAKKFGYAHYYLPSLKIDAAKLLLRIIPKYIFSSGFAFLAEIGSLNFSFYQNIFYYFTLHALPYEKIFSSYCVKSELGHNFFSASHIAEAIICENHGAKYFLMHWSDNSVVIDTYLMSYLGCDYFLLWGKAHLLGVEGNFTTFVYTGYPFKRSIRQVASNRQRFFSEMGIHNTGQIVSFFDESFGRDCKMTEEHFVNFWLTAYKFAELAKNQTVIIKPKDINRYHHLSLHKKREFLDLLSKLKALPNFYIVDDQKWSFIEVIGISDVVVTQGMTSSATIALVCGIEALYFDEASYNHPFSVLLKDKIVFNSQEKLLNKLTKIIYNNESVFNEIPQRLIREYDAFENDSGIDIYRQMLADHKIAKV